jgi:hypothetical protein
MSSLAAAAAAAPRAMAPEGEALMRDGLDAVVRVSKHSMHNSYKLIPLGADPHGRCVPLGATAHAAGRACQVQEVGAGHT